MKSMILLTDPFTVGQTLGISPTADYWENSLESWAEYIVYAPQLTWDTMFGDWHQIYTESEAIRQSLYLEWLLEQAKCTK